MTTSAATKAMQMQIETHADKIDAIALVAKSARDGLAHHEDICALRYEAISKAQNDHTDTLKAVQSSLKEMDKKRSDDTKELYGRLWIFAGAIGTCMFAIIMALLFNH